MIDDIFNVVCLTNYLDERNKIDNYDEFFKIILKRIIKNKFDTSRFIYRIFNNEIVIFSDPNPKDPLFIWSIFKVKDTSSDPITGLKQDDFIDKTSIEFTKNDTLYRNSINGIIKIDLKRAVELCLFSKTIKPIISKNFNLIYFYNDNNTIVYEYINDKLYLNETFINDFHFLTFK